MPTDIYAALSALVRAEAARTAPAVAEPAARNDEERSHEPEPAAARED